MTIEPRARKAVTARPRQDRGASRQREAPSRPHDFPVVGVGASAGGLEALDKLFARGGEITEADILEATISGSVLRLRPKLMTVSVVMAGLVPIIWSTGVGSDIMKPIAAPIIGGMITSTIHVLIITPVIFYIMKVHALRKGTLKVSGMTL